MQCLCTTNVLNNIWWHVPLEPCSTAVLNNNFTSYEWATVCPRSRYPFYIVSYYINWVTTFWTHSSWSKSIYLLEYSLFRTPVFRTNISNGIYFLPSAKRKLRIRVELIRILILSFKTPDPTAKKKLDSDPT